MSYPRILQKWFNLPPWPDASYVLIRGGEKIWFWMNENPTTKIRFYWRGSPAARVMLIQHPEFLEIADIVVHLKRLRSRGLGSSMFGMVVEIARNRGAPAVVGKIHPETPADWDRLLKFYARQGCEIREKEFVFHL